MGFFDRNKLDEMHREVPKTVGCGVCGLFKTCRTPYMPATGTGEISILFVAEAPGEQEDVRGTQLIGEAGQFLRTRLLDIGVKLDSCRKTNAVICRPPKNRTPKKIEIDSCRKKLLKEIKEHKSKVIIPMGNTAVESLIGDRWKKDLGKVSKWHGWIIPDQDLQCWVCPTFHPSYVMRDTTPEVANVIFKRELARACNMINETFPVIPKVDITIETRPNRIVHQLIKWQGRTDPMSFDYETTGKKPHAEGHRIVSCAISWDGVSAYSFPMEDKNVQEQLGLLLIDKRIPKIAHNMKFEEMWSRELLGLKVQNWKSDTMLAAHILDNREGITSLKFQAYVQFGIVDYDSKVAPFLTSPKKEGANAFNRITEVPQNDLLYYGGMDALLEWRLNEKQVFE